MRTAVVGGQFGSEGKGLIVGHLAEQYDHHVRVGAANAGHTFYTRRGQLRGERINPTHVRHVMQQIPCAAYANPHAILYIGPGALISPEILQHEMDELTAWREARALPHAEVLVDARAHVITQDQIDDEAASGLEARIGSTSATAKEGIGQAQADRVMRRERCVPAAQWFADYPMEGVRIADVPAKLSSVDSLLLEGTQGVGLSLTTGAFPYVTSRNTTAAGLCADSGVGPQLDEVILVCRTFPIRVAGNSGPFWFDSEETTWAAIGVDEQTERTTVTKKVRRVATFSMEQVIEACFLNGATAIALTFCDYLDPSIAGINGVEQEFDIWSFPAVADLVESIKLYSGVDVKYLGTGPHSVIEL